MLKKGDSKKTEKKLNQKTIIKIVNVIKLLS